jgi:dihydrofolate reductase
MRKLNSALFITLDGVVEAPGGETSLPEYARGWSMPYTDDEVGGVIGAAMASSDAMLLGRNTYQEFAAFWPSVPEDDFFGNVMNNRTKYVVSTTLNTADWKNSHIIKGANFAGEISKLKQQEGQDINTVGSATLVRSLLKANLVDELQLMLCPVVLGVGKRLFENADFHKTLTPVESRHFGSGMIYLRLQPNKQA